MRPLFVVNPRSGGGRAGAMFDGMRAPIERRVGEFDAVFTERPRHACEIAQRAAEEGRETVVAVGGDGLIHEVVNGLMRAREGGKLATRLGVLGQGTGGDYRKTFGIEHRLDAYLDAIAGGKTRRVDVGSFTYRDHKDDLAKAYFANILSIGLGGLVDRYVAGASRALGGTVAYFNASLRAILESEVAELDCVFFRGEEEERVRIPSRSLAICIGKYFGSGMMVAPMAEPDDGIFDVIDLGAAPRLKFALRSSKIYDGSHMKLDDVKHYRCEAVSVGLEDDRVRRKFPLDVDGEPLGLLPIDVRMEASALELFVPAR